MNTTKILYCESGYSIERNILNIPFNRHTLQSKKVNLSKIITHISHKLSVGNSIIGNSHWEFLTKSNAVWHFWNTVSFGSTPWVVTYETLIPRWPSWPQKVKHKGVEALAGKSCKKLIALSNCAKKIQVRYLQENFPTFTEIISRKIEVVHPPQRQLIKAYEEKKLPTDKLIFTIIGADFFRKGGKEILFVFDKLFERNASLELNIISRMEYGDYASRTKIDDLKYAQSIINKYPDRIHHYESLPNYKVLDKLKNSHVGLLPTYADTFGYSVLEAQACACPVITTNIRALPEINNNSRGWMINVPKDKWDNSKLDTSKERAKFSKIIQKQLFAIIASIIADPEQIQKKGLLALQHIRNNHDPNDVAKKLEGIYDSALS